jgi:hypothetical protein
MTLSSYVQHLLQPQCIYVLATVLALGQSISEDSPLRSVTFRVLWWLWTVMVTLIYHSIIEPRLEQHMEAVSTDRDGRTSQRGDNSLDLREDVDALKRALKNTIGLNEEAITLLEQIQELSAYLTLCNQRLDERVDSYDRKIDSLRRRSRLHDEDLERMRGRIQRLDAECRRFAAILHPVWLQFTMTQPDPTDAAESTASEDLEVSNTTDLEASHPTSGEKVPRLTGQHEGVVTEMSRDAGVTQETAEET